MKLSSGEMETFLSASVALRKSLLWPFGVKSYWFSPRQLILMLSDLIIMTYFPFRSVYEIRPPFESFICSNLLFIYFEEQAWAYLLCISRAKSNMVLGATEADFPFNVAINVSWYFLQYYLCVQFITWAVQYDE